MSSTTIYKVRVSNGDYSPSWPYQGTDKDIAVAVATAYIQQGKRVTILEAEIKQGPEKSRTNQPTN